MSIEVREARARVDAYFANPKVQRRRVPDVVQKWVKRKVVAAKPKDLDQVGDWCGDLTGFAIWYYAEHGTIAGPVEKILSAENRTAYVNSVDDISDSSAPTKKSVLGRILRQIVDATPPADPRGRRPAESTAAPNFSQRETQALYQWCVAEDERTGRVDGQAIFGLAFGCGAYLKEMDTVTRVVIDDETVRVTFGKYVQRTVEVLPGLAADALRAAYSDADGSPFETEPGRTAQAAYDTLASAFVRFVQRYGGRKNSNVPPWFNFDRSRSTFYVEKILAGTRLDILCDEAGVQTAVFNRYLQYVRAEAARRARAAR